MYLYDTNKAETCATSSQQTQYNDQSVVFFLLTQLNIFQPLVHRLARKHVSYMFVVLIQTLPEKLIIRTRFSNMH